MFTILTLELSEVTPQRRADIAALELKGGFITPCISHDIFQVETRN